MEFNKYQVKAKETAIYPRDSEILALSYTVLGLVGEAGEIANKVKKIIRDKSGRIDDKTRSDLSKELGDVLWYLSTLASELGIELNDVAEDNIKKLYSRKERGVLGGTGDNR
tara:strand:- start:2164 stop:2499 length:336 start_codon:yes stop_codon:yes gene_type:complete